MQIEEHTLEYYHAILTRLIAAAEDRPDWDDSLAELVRDAESVLDTLAAIIEPATDIEELDFNDYQ